MVVVHDDDDDDAAAAADDDDDDDDDSLWHWQNLLTNRSKERVSGIPIPGELHTSAYSANQDHFL